MHYQKTTSQFTTPDPRPIFETIRRRLKHLKLYRFSQFVHLKLYSFTGGTNQNDSIDSNMKKLCGELAWYVQALENHKSSANGVPKSVMASWELIAA